MTFTVALEGVGHAVGARSVDNQDVAAAFGLPSDWYAQRTGIVQRRVCGSDEDVLTLSADAVRRACADAGLDPAGLGPDTVLMHIQNGITHFTPPAGIVLAAHLGMSGVRVVGLDGVCAEPIAALDLAVTMLAAGRCQRVIISAGVDFLSYLDPSDRDTAGLFGAGAGALVISGGTTGLDLVIEGLEWETHTRYWEMGMCSLRALRNHTDGVELSCSHYTMQGQGLYRVFRTVVPQVIKKTLAEAGWTTEDVDLVISHQPNPRQLELSASRMGIRSQAMPMPGRLLGNMGPASLLVNLSMARDSGALAAGTRVLLLAFGLGFSCGAVAMRVGSP